jgi:hypothetical protein
MFFFEKKNQKTFMTLRPLKTSATHIGPMPSLRAQRSNPGSCITLAGAQPSLANPHHPQPKPTPAQSHKSLFASFSSEKEESFP